MANHTVPRRASLATVVGSSLAVVAAGSLLAFSSLAEQAGLQGLATGGLQPAHPGRTGSGGRAITIAAPPSAPPSDPRETLAEAVRESGRRMRARTVAPVETAETERRPRREKAEPGRPSPVDRARVAVAERDVASRVGAGDGETAASAESESAGRDGPPYGHAYGHHAGRGAPRPSSKRVGPSRRTDHARSATDESERKDPKAPQARKVEKVEKVEKAPRHSNGKAKGHLKHGDAGNGHSNGRAKGHPKHAHKGRGKGHSKHGG
jgi:hypothetical protein